MHLFCFICWSWSWHWDFKTEHLKQRGDVLLTLQRCLTIVKLIKSMTAMMITAASAVSGM